MAIHRWRAVAGSTGSSLHVFACVQTISSSSETEDGIELSSIGPLRSLQTPPMPP